MFKDYIKPEWEDIKNKNGGRWIYDIAWDKSKHQFISQYTENVWTKLILSLIGNLFEENEYFICIYYQLHNRNPKDGYEPLYQL